MLKLLMVGAGGIGGYYAARLLESGHRVILTARGDHLHALASHGLKVYYEGRELIHRPEALSHQQLAAGFHPDDFDVIIIALKSTATVLVTKELGTWLRQGRVPVLSLQNGVDNEPLLADVIGTERIIGGLAVRIGGHIARPGVVEAEGVAEIVMGEWPAVGKPGSARSLLLKKLAAVFDDSGIPTTLSDNIRYELWRKLVINNGVNPLSALTGLDTRSLTHHPELSRIVYGMMAETVEASRADDVNLTQKDLHEMFELISSFNAIKTSMLIDREKGRPLELDSIAGAVLKRCTSLGIDSPYTSTIATLLKQQAS
ncbi:2-dehydropantoate 2-reductase [Marinobacter salarius]|uniref:ketopantoate reductase family protein n=1 Tax=Marinobacter TaxID=2742 RepID=UPI001D1853FE|nr:2-dehydropantoate 2-reductase [Marinobacter salarius]MCC4283973.1 2-dehydropantoate 2-reductase [Marinobacter salarius]